MIQNKNIANAGWIIGCKIVQSVLALVISMLTARYLGPMQFGVINYATALVTFVTPVASLGLSHVIVQETVYSPDDEGKILGSSIVMSLVSSVFCIVGVVSFSIIGSSSDKETIIVCALYALLLIANAFELVQYWFQAKLISKYTSVVSVFAYVVISTYRAILLITKQNIYWFAVSNAIDHMIIGIVLIIIYKRKCSHKLRFSLEWSKRLLSKSRYFIVSSMMVTIFAQTDKIMLKFMMGDVATGIYSAAAVCSGMTSFVFAALIDSMRPTVLECKKNSSPSYETNICRLYSIIIYVALAQSLVMTLLARPIILIMYGREYVASVSVLRVVVWQSTFSYIGSVRNIWILAEEKQQYLWVINLSGAITNVILNIILIGIWGIEGAALASVITQVFTNFIIGFVLKPIKRNNWLLIEGLHPMCLINVLKSILGKKNR